MPTVALHRGPASVSVDDGEPRRLLAWNRHDPPFEDVQYATRAEVFTASIHVGPETITLDVSGEAPGPLGSTIDLTLHWRNGSTATAVGAIVDLIGDGNGGHAFRVEGYLTSPWPLLTGASGDLDRRPAREGQDRVMPDLLYPAAAGCVGAVHRPGGAPAPCEVEPTCTVAHRYRYPRPHTARLLACARHAQGEPDPRALTDGDRADLARRRRVRAEAVALRDANRARGEAKPR